MKAFDLSNAARSVRTNAARFTSTGGNRAAARRVARPGSRACVCGKTISANKSLCGACSVAAFTQRQKPDYWGEKNV
jgi:hypothetical protein